MALLYGALFDGLPPAYTPEDIIMKDAQRVRRCRRCHCLYAFRLHPPPLILLLISQVKL